MESSYSPAVSTAALWRRYARFRRSEDRNALVAHYAPLARACAGRVMRQAGPTLHFDEVYCAALSGLLRAVEAYNPARAVPFEAYSRRRISGAILDWLRSSGTKSRAVRHFERATRRASERIRAAAGRMPSDGELAAHLRISAARFRELAGRTRAADPVPFSALECRLPSRGAGRSRSWDIHDAAAIDPAQSFARSLLCDWLGRGLSADERQVLWLYYFDDRSMADIARTLRRSPARVSQINREVLKRLRQRHGARLADELSC